LRLRNGSREFFVRLFETSIGYARAGRHEGAENKAFPPPRSRVEQTLGQDSLFSLRFA
jgi:hypothetical protein